MSRDPEPAGGRGAEVPGGDRDPFDTSVAHSARVHDYWLGGKDNYAADRAAGDAVIAAYPGIVKSVRANRAFLARAVHFLAAEAGIRQFLDVGTGIPAADNTHEVAQAAEVARFFDGLQLVEPGLVPVQEWRPRSEVEARTRSAMWGGVGRKR